MSALLAYTVFWLLAVVLPGVCAQRLLRLRWDAALVLPVGAALCAGAQALALVSGRRWVFAASLGLIVLGGFLRRGSSWERAAGPSLFGALLPWLTMIALFALTQYPYARLDANGDFLLDALLPADTCFHVGVTRELSLGWPPQVPGLSGFPLGYHFGLDLLRSAALDWAASDPFDQSARFDLTWMALALVLALRAAAQRLGFGPAAVTLAGFTPLLTDFSWLLSFSPQAHWWADLLRGNLLLSLFLANPAVPALALALGALLALARHLDGEGPAWLALAMLQAGALPHFKVFLGAHLLLGLGVLVLLRPRLQVPALAVALPAAVSTAVLVLGQGGRSVELALAPFGLVADTFATLDLAPRRGLALLAWALPWLVASLGARVLAIPLALRTLRDGPPLGVALAAMALAGWPLALLLRVSAPELLPGESVINDAAYLVEQSGPLLWLLAAGALCAPGRSRAWRLAGPVLLALSLPSSAHFVLKKSALAPIRVPASMGRAARALLGPTRPGDVVLQRPAGRFPPAPLIFASRRVPLERFTPYLTQFASRDELEARHEQVAQFFRTRDLAEARAIAKQLGARALVLYGSDRVRFDVERLGRPVHVEPDARVYALD